MTLSCSASVSEDITISLIKINEFFSEVFLNESIMCKVYCVNFLAFASEYEKPNLSFY